MTKKCINRQTAFGLAWIIGLGSLSLTSGCANPNGCFGNTPTYGPYNGYQYPYGAQGTYQPPPNVGTPMMPNNGVPMGQPGMAQGGFAPGMNPPPAGYYNGPPPGNIPAPFVGR